MVRDLQGPHTIPVSAARCWDWKCTASMCPHFGHFCFDRGSCEIVNSQSVRSLRVRLRNEKNQEQCVESSSSERADSSEVSESSVAGSPQVTHFSSFPHIVQKEGT